MKRNFTLKTIFAVLMLICTVNLNAQDRTCGMVEYMEEMMQDPDFAREYELNQKKFKAEVARRLSTDFNARGGNIVIPVAVHFPSGNEADRACLEALAQNQIDILNADYTATNSDIGLWTPASAFYPGLNPGVANISFCLAVSNHPVGIDPELLEGNPAVSIGYNFGGGNNADTNWAGYMNFVVRDIGPGLLGFSPLGGSIAAGQAVTMNLGAFGSGSGCPGSGIVPGAPFNLGRTVTHELGHFYNLNHPWGPGAPSCAADDGIADTPNTGQETYNCPNPGTQPGCNAGEFVLHMNYMDYVNDACMYMFTPDQMAVVDGYVAGVLAPQFKPNVCTPPAPGFNLVSANNEISSCPTVDNQVVFNFSYNTILSFTETTTFSASGAPAGATVTFSPTSLSADGDFTMTVGNLGATAEGEYTITVTGTSATVTESTDVLLKNTCTEVVCDPFASATNLNLAIVDGNAGNPGTPFLTNILTLPDLGAPIESISVNVDVSHTFVSDLIVRIIHPDGVTFVDVWNGNCGSNANFDVTFDDTAPAITCASPTTGTYAPTNPLSAFAGLATAGDWTILIADFFAADTGQLNDWSITVCTEQPLSVAEFGSDEFLIFPNPNQGEFTIKLNSSSNEDIIVDVYDIRGRRIFNNTYVNNADFNEVVRLNNVQSGMYLVTVSDGDKKTTKKIIVE
ncbi:Por secretion system C-terminal sorting domain-containing protein [Formosa sp. Hel1_31_208]|uniref:zinc-dependent metalloprotease n=1 Tax=Formosa sp. Hel1_31_208 TaxID=1798225 RepID=UPI00087A7E42|nr:T9SS type A sorting domain-containing protein [Formosa sp. Hel1_31_208]SDR69064.1 Por secretion system C-terminal sorting domain-containing protein [Formosa sp. Hel1_31_208]